MRTRAPPVMEFAIVRAFFMPKILITGGYKMPAKQISNKDILARLKTLQNSIMEILPISAEETPEIMQTVDSTINDFTAYAQKGAF